MRALAIAATFATTHDARAGEDSPSDAIVYGAAIRNAEAVAPDLAAVRARADVAAAGVGVAKIFTNPVGSLGTTTDGARFVSALTVPLPVTRRSSSIRAAESTAAASAAEVPLLQLDARLAAANAWCDLWLAERTLEVARDSEVRASRLSSAAEQRYLDGSGSRLDAARAKAESARSHAEVLARQELVASASATLAYWLGKEPAALIRASGAPPDAKNVQTVPVLMARLEAHPQFARAAARARAATAALDVQKSQAWPTFGVQLGATLWDRQAPENNFSAGLVFDVPVFNVNGPAVAQAEKHVGEVGAESNAAIARLRSDLVAAYASLKATMARAEALEREVVPASQVAADLSTDAYRTGAIDLSEVLLAEKALADAKQAAFDAVAQRGRALAALERALGAPL